MYNISNEYKKQVAIAGRRKDTIIEIKDGELTVGEVNLMSVEQFNNSILQKLISPTTLATNKITYKFKGQLYKTIMREIDLEVKGQISLVDKILTLRNGIKVNNKFEYINYGDFIVKNIEDVKNKETIKVTAYDNMLKFMIPFDLTKINVTLPCTIGVFSKALARYCGVELYTEDFFNKDIIIDEDYFTVQKMTCRDVLEKLAQATLCTIFIKENKLYFCNINDTKEVLDINVLKVLKLENKFGPVNSFVLGRGDVEDNVYHNDPNSINANGLCEIRFDENEILDNKKEEVITNMFNQINGLEFYPFEAKEVGLGYLEPCDLVTCLDRQKNEYKCLVLNLELTITSGMTETISAEVPTTTTTEYKYATKEEKANLKTWRLAKKNEGIIEDVVKQTTENTEKTSEHTQTIDSIKDKVSSVEKKAVTTVDVFYALGDTTTTAPTTGWTTTAPQWQQGKYMWQKTKTTYADGTINESTPICIAGAKGDKGDKGEQGIQGLQGEKGEQGIAGKDGTAGKTSYFHIKYSAVANPTKESEISEVPNTYIGTYVDFTEADSTDPSKYIWSRFEGLQGEKGEQGIPGTNGINGTSYYLHIKYSDDGKTFTSNNGETVGNYIGVKTDTNVNDSTVFSDYKWSKTKGETGVGVKKLVEQYYLSTSISAVQGGSWEIAQVKWEEGKYIWTRTQITWTDNSVTYTDPILATNTNDAFSEINQTKDAIKEKVGKGEFGTLVEQNWEHVKYAWNQISEFIQMEILNGNASLAFRKDADNLLMALDKLGQHFYSNNKNIMDVKVAEITPEQSISKKALMFLLDTIEMGNEGVLGWGYKANENGKEIIIPAIYLGEVNSGEGYGVHVAPTIPLFLSLNKIYTDNEELILELENKFNLKKNGNTILNTFTNEEGTESFNFNNNALTGVGGITLDGGFIIGAGNIPTSSTVEYFLASYSSNYLFVGQGENGFSIYANSSDRNLKKNIKNTSEKALDKINQIKHKEFDWKANEEHQNIGYIAQDMELIDKNFVHHTIFTDKDNKKHEDWQINTLSVLATATKAIQEQQEQIETQNNLIQELIKRIEKLEGGNNE